VRNEEVLQRVEEDRNILQTIKRRKATWMDHILCRNCLLNKLLKERYREGEKRQVDEEEDVISY
jgi:hypothetical protein